MRTEKLLRQLEYRVLGPTDADREASLELAVSAKRFSERTAEVIDDKLSFSATLMRAGEVEAANKLLAEVEQEVLDEEAALFEAVNEVKVARSMDPSNVTRGRLARTLALAMLTSSILAFSAVGMAVAGLFRGERSPIDIGSRAQERSVDSVLGTRLARAPKNAIKIAGVRLRLTDAQLQRYQKLTSGSVNEEELEMFLLNVLPPQQAALVQSILVAAIDAAPPKVGRAIEQLGQVERPRRATAAETPQQQPSEGAASDDSGETKEQGASPTPSNSESPDGSCSNEEPEDGGGLPGLPVLSEDCKGDEG